MKNDIKLEDIFMMKKPHACGGSLWKVTRLGVDLKLQCLECGHEIMMDRLDFYKKIKKKVEKPNE